MHRSDSGRRLHELRAGPPVKAAGIPAALRVALIVAALAAMVSGYVWGDPLVIWQKAASICLECIGVG